MHRYSCVFNFMFHLFFDHIKRIFQIFKIYFSLIHYIPTTANPIINPHSPSSLLSFRSTPPLYPFIKTQASRGEQVNKEYQVTTVLITNANFKVVGGYPVGGSRSQEKARES